MINHHKMKNKRYFYRNGLLVQQRFLTDKREHPYRLLVEMTLPGAGLSTYAQYYREEPAPAELRRFAEEAKAFFEREIKRVEIGGDHERR